MIINATTGTGFLGAISYIHKEHEKDFTEEQKPRILEENMVFGSVAEQAYLMRSIAIRNSRSSRPVLHLSISFHKEEVISEEIRDVIFDKILEELGATRDNNQFIIAQHFDAAHEHYHILINKVGFDRSNINTSYIINKCQVIADKIELEVGLRRTLGRTVVYDPTNPKGFRYTTPEERNKKEVFLDKSVGVRDVKTFLRNNIETLMKQTFNVNELLEKLEETGINTDAKFNEEGVLKGISFRYNNQAYKGTQLGLKSKEIENYYAQKNKDLVIEDTRQSEPEKSVKEIFEEEKRELTTHIRKLEKIFTGYKNATQKVADKIKDGEINIDTLFKSLEDSRFIINNDLISYEGFSFDADILIRWMEKSIISIEKQKKEYEKKVLDYSNLMSQRPKETSFFMLPGKKRKIRSENEDLNFKKEMAEIPKLDISGISSELIIQQQINLQIKKLRDKIQEIESKERIRVSREKELRIKQEGKRLLSTKDFEIYLTNRRKYKDSEDYKINFLEYYEHENIFKDLFWLDKSIFDLGDVDKGIEFLMDNFGITYRDADALMFKFFELNEETAHSKIELINSLANRIIYEEDNIQSQRMRL